ncbi:MAG: winged helix DNA-binding protein [Rhizobiaceae bacterium]|jgi:DNA-binding MarR family transcriptional regulator|nr:winged helix DNA-binding protein [Rhizobiaceae bacterium]
MNLQDLHLGDAIGVFANSVTTRLNEAVTQVSGLSPSACAAIVKVGTEPDKPIDHLRKALSLQHSSAVRLIKRLETQGLLDRNRGYGGDMRHVRLTLTPAGEECLAKIVSARCKILRQMVNSLDENGQEKLREQISHLMSAIQRSPA